MFEYPVVYVDIETTGGSYRNSRVLEIAVIRVEDGEVVRELSTIVDPETPVPGSITRLTGINSGDTIGKPLFYDISEDLIDIMQGAVFIAHNVRFDYSFIKHEFSRIGVEFAPKLLCTVRLSRALYATQQGHSLQKLIERHNIEVDSRHRALDDARAMMRFTEIAFEQHGYELFNEAVKKQLKTQSLPVHLDASEIEAIEDVPGVYIFRDENGLPVYVGKSVALKKRVMSHFQSTTLKEVKMAQQVHHVETIQTGSELSALLLESKLVKELQPVFNRMLRRISQYAMLVKTERDDYSTLDVRIGNVGEDTDLSSIYGLFRNRTMAKKKLDEVTRLFNLCPKLMGLEKASGACFSYSLGKCKGACVGKESAELYNRRFEIALENTKLASWEYPSAIVVPITETGESVVIDNWIIRGFINPEGEFVLSTTEPSFDVDEYKIIRRFVRENALFVQMYEA